MKKFSLLLLSFILIAVSVNAQDLPNFMTDKEKEIYKTYTAPEGFPDDITPPPTPVRTMAEWEELSGILITWTSYTAILRSMVDYAQEEGLVYIVCTDSNSVKSYLTAGSVPLVNLKFLITSFNSVWCRDYGPWCVYTLGMDTLKLIDWTYNRPRPLDDVVPVFLANYLNLPLHQATTAPYDFIATGGNFMVDGNGTGFSSKLILNENPTHTVAEIDTIAKKYMGLNRYIKMETLPYDGIHHIDMHMKLLDEETIMVGQYPAGISDGPQIEINLQYILNNFQTAYGRPFKVVRIPMPPSSGGQYPPNSSYFTYTNSTFINKTVMVPVYGFALDATALQIYRDALPGYNVYGIDCNASIGASGAIHCINKDIGVKEPVLITHGVLRNTNNTTSPYEVKAYIKTKSGISNAKVYWTTDTTLGFAPLNMTAVADTFRASIPAQTLGKKVFYYITATSNNSKTGRKPITAPVGFYKFTIENPSGTGNNELIAADYSLSQNYPNPFNPITLIKYSVREKGFVTIKIFDMLGREVHTLVNESKTPGEYSAFWNASGFTSGMYFYKIQAGDFSDTKKMILLK